MRIAGAVTVAVGLVMTTGAVVAMHRDRPTPSSFGSVSAPVAARPEPHPVRASVPVLGPTPVRPAGLRIPALGVAAPVEGVVTHHGVLGVPANVRHVGWWIGSAAPGSPAGTTVIDGHVDSAADGAGALFRLADLRAGARVTVLTARGAGITYRVYARRVYGKTHPLPAALFAPTGAPRLLLITCGGPFDAGRRSYVDNVAVFARPVDPR